jgi:hypothetical protein
MQNNIISPALSGSGAIRPPFALRLMQWLPVLRRIPSRLIGMGFQPEHVRL